MNDIHIHLPPTGLAAEQFHKLDSKLDHIIHQGERILTRQEQLEEAMVKVDKATTDLGGNLQNISDDIDLLIQNAKDGTITAESLTRLQAKADLLSTLADASKGIASKVDNPVPVPIPVPDPSV